MAIIKRKFKTYLILAGFAVLVFAVPNSSIAQASGIDTDDVIKLLNQTRQEKGLKPLTENSKLDQAARDKAQDMVKNDYFAHTSPGGIDPWHWFKKVGYDYKYAGENLAVNYASAESQHKAWMNSKTHRANILNANYREVGIAVISGKIDGEESLLTVELFGTPVYVPVSNTPKATVPLPQKEEVKSEQDIKVQTPVPAEPEAIIPQVPAEIPQSLSQAEPVIKSPENPLPIEAGGFAHSANLFFAVMICAAILANPLVFLSKAYAQIYKAFRKKAPAAQAKENKSSKRKKKITDDFRNLLNHKHVVKAVKINSS